MGVVQLPDMTTVLLIPGQGSQTEGMGEEARALAPDLVEAAVAAVGEDPFPRVTDSTAFAQPAILTSSLARARSLPASDGPVVALGHSLGELGALVLTGILGEEDAIRLSAERGRLMARAGEGDRVTGMLAVIGGTPQDAAALADAHGLTVANDNSPGQVVLAGEDDALTAARQAARPAGLRAIRLDVAGAFHSPVMAPAQDAFAAVLADTAFSPPADGAIAFSPTTLAPIEDPADVLARALVSPVRFREAVLALDAAGAARWLETGPGEVLSGLVRRTLPDADIALHDPAGAARAA